MEFSLIKGLWEKYSKLKVFSSVFGVSFALLFLVVLFGVPHTAHADIGSAIATGLGWVGDIVGSFASWTFGGLAMGIAYLILALANFILFLVGMLFNYVVVNTVFNFGSYFGNSAGLLAGWGVLRDIANIALIFGFVMLGLAVILDIHGYEVKKTLPRLIIFAILMNFSLLASEAVIDTANVFASVFYAQSSATCAAGTTAADCAAKGTNDGISGEIFQLSGISTVFSQDSNNAPNTATYTRWAVAYLGMAIFVTILAIVLLAGAIMLVTRAITLAILMILSPLGFAGLAIPSLEKYAKDWWHRLIGQAFFAPVYLLFIFVGLKIAQGMSAGHIDLIHALTSGDSSSMGSIFIFAILIGFMTAALAVAKQMGATGADFAVKFAGGAVYGTMGFVGRRTVGRGSTWAANKIASSEFAQRHPGLGQFAHGIAKKGSESSFDFRQTGLLKQAGLDLGKPGKTASHGYHGIEKKAVEDRENFRKELKPSDRQNAVVTELEAQLEDMNHSQANEREPILNRLKQQQERVAEARKAGNAEILNTERAAFNATLEEYQTTIKSQAANRKEVEKRLKASTAEAQREVTENYIGGLHAGAPRGLKTLYKFTVGPHADHIAIGKLRKEASMSNLEKALNGIRAEVEKTRKDDDHDDDHHAPAPVVPAGGGGGGGGGGHGGH